MWQTLVDDSSLAIIDSNLVPSNEGVTSSDDGFGPLLENVFYKDQTMAPFATEARKLRTGSIVAPTVIAVGDRAHDNSGAVIT